MVDVVVVVLATTRYDVEFQSFDLRRHIKRPKVITNRTSYISLGMLDRHITSFYEFLNYSFRVVDHNDSSNRRATIQYTRTFKDIQSFISTSSICVLLNVEF